MVETFTGLQSVKDCELHTTDVGLAARTVQDACSKFFRGQVIG